MKKRQIVLKNVCVHNLKGVDLTLDPGTLIVFSGVSGSGKSSLAFCYLEWASPGAYSSGREIEVSPETSLT